MTTITGADVRTADVTGPRTSPTFDRSLIAVPIIVLIGLGLLGVYLSSRTLDSVEQRLINAPNIIARMQEQLYITAVSTVAVIVLAIPIGIWLSRPALRRVQPAVLALGGFMQALPPFGVIVLLVFTPLGLGSTTAIVALVIASFLPVVTNTVVGLRHVDTAMIEAARGMGMSARQTLLRVELPLAVPVMVAGIRVALVLNVATATLATYIGAGGLGDIIDGALSLGRPDAVLVGAALVAALALTIDWLAGVAEFLVRRRSG
jgi:osmoprotectant transport system permease protein